MPIERSAGAVIFRRPQKDPQPILYLLLHYEAGHWDFPKGNIEKGESTKDTVRREILEETGISKLDLIPGFRETVHYFYWRGKKKISKWVVYLLTETRQESVKISFEHKGYDWLAYDVAAERLTYQNSQAILKKAHEFLNKKAPPH